MSENENYSKLTLEVLIAEEKAIKKKKIIFAVIAAILTGFTIFQVARNNDGFINVMLPLVGIYLVTRNSGKLKNIQTEIKKRSTAENGRKL